MKKQILRFLTIGAAGVVFWSCNNDSDNDPQGEYTSGVFVSNYGNFQANNGSLSYFNRDASKKQINAYLTANAIDLATGGVTGFASADKEAVILVDNSAAGLDVIEIADAATLKSKATISKTVENPREAVAVSGSKVFVSCWDALNADYSYNPGYLAVVDLSSKTVTNKIPLDKGPEKLVLHNGQVFVGTAGFTSNTLTVVNIANESIAKTITFPSNPTPVGIDANGKLWVNAADKFYRVNPTSYAVEDTIAIGSTKSAGPFAFTQDKKTIIFGLSYYDANWNTLGDMYKFGITETTVNLTTPFKARYFGALASDPKDGLLYGGATPSFGQSGYALRYKADGTLVDSIQVGIAPRSFYFK